MTLGIQPTTPNTRYLSKNRKISHTKSNRSVSNESIQSDSTSTTSNMNLGPNTVKLQNGYVQSLPYSFAEPTFSELMRRSTADHDDFQTSLRKPAGLGQPPLIQGPLDGGYGKTMLSS